MGLLSDEKRPPCSPLQRPTGTFVTNPHPQGRLGTLEPAAGGCRGTRPGWTRCARLAAWRRRELGPTPGAPGQRNEAPEGRGRPSARPGPAAPGGSFPAPPSSAPSCMDSCRSCSAPDATPTPRARLPFPLLAPPRFLGSALGRALPQEPGRGAGPLLASLLSLSIHCAPRASPTALGATCRVVSVPQTGPCPLTSGLGSPRFSCPVLPAVPQPHRPPLLAPSLLLRPSPLGCALLAPSVFRVLALL